MPESLKPSRPKHNGVNTFTRLDGVGHVVDATVVDMLPVLFDRIFNAAKNLFDGWEYGCLAEWRLEASADVMIDLFIIAIF